MRDLPDPPQSLSAPTSSGLAGALETLADAARSSEFGDRPIPEPILARLVDMALRMPAEHEQPTGRWIIVRSSAAHARVALAAYGQSVVATAPVLIVALADREPERVCGAGDRLREVSRGERTLEESHRLAALAARAPERWPSRGLWAVRHAMLTVAAVLIGAAEAGLAARLVPDFDHARLREALGIPDDHEIAALVALGFPGAPYRPTSAPSLDGLAFAEHFGQPWIDPTSDPTEPDPSRP
jgi:nitroreductase